MKFKAFDLSRAGTGFYLTAIPANVLFEIARVDRVSEKPKDGFQRQLDTPRAKRIAKYLEDRVIPGAIILSSTDNNNSPIFNPTTNELEISDKEGSLLVIDGQHRLYGSFMAHGNGITDILLPVCILTNLTHIDEVQYFIDINSYAKGVPKTLRIELSKFLAKENSIDDIRLKLFKDLNTETDSVLCGKLSAEQRGPGYLSHVPFEIAINKALNSSRMKDLEYEDKKSLLKNYLYGIYNNLLENNLPQKITQSAFFQAIFRIFDKVCENSLLYRGNYKAETFEYVFEAIHLINFDFHSGSNEDAISNLEKDLIDKLDIDRRGKKPLDLF